MAHDASMGFPQVTKEAFFACIGKLDVNPRADLNSLKGREHISHWETPARQLLGVSISDSHGVNVTRFYLRPASGSR